MSIRTNTSHRTGWPLRAARPLRTLRTSGAARARETTRPALALRALDTGWPSRTGRPTAPGYPGYSPLTLMTALAARPDCPGWPPLTPDARLTPQSSPTDQAAHTGGAKRTSLARLAKDLDNLLGLSLSQGRENDPVRHLAAVLHGAAIATAQSKPGQAHFNVALYLSGMLTLNLSGKLLLVIPRFPSREDDQASEKHVAERDGVHHG